jgi:hypothetical protein
MADKAPSKQTATDGTIVAPSPAELMLRKMAGMATADFDQRKNSVDDLNVILDASDEEFWDSDERIAISAKTLSGCVIEIRDFDVKYGDSAVGDDDITSPFISPDGRQMYLLIEASMIDKRQQVEKLLKLPEVGEIFQFNTSARYVVAKIMSAHNRGWLDDNRTLRVRVVGTPIKNGKQRVEKLKEADAPYVASGVVQSEEVPF